MIPSSGRPEYSRIAFWRTRHCHFTNAIRIGDAESGWVDEFILYPWGDPRSTRGDGAEFVAVDAEGNIYGAEPMPRQLRKYVRVRK